MTTSVEIDGADVQRLVKDLFTDGVGDVAETLQLRQGEKYLGGWAAEPMTDYICDWLNIERPKRAAQSQGAK